MDYKNTLNLPHTDLPMKAGLASKEPELLKYWDSINLYQKIREKKKGKELYLLHDGPPYANGDIHLGHAVNKVLKDITIKFQSFMGKDAPYVPGWDCHGLPIELNVEKKFSNNKDKIASKQDFTDACRTYAESQVSKQREDFIRLGVLGDWFNPYLTMSKSFEADIVRALGRIVTNGHLERGEKPVHWCMSCGSALAEAEVEYQNKISSSIDVLFEVNSKSIDALLAQFKINDCKNAFFVIWTTTPWTLPANVGVTINPEMEYSLCDSIHGNLIIATDLVDSCSLRWNQKLRIIAKAKGSDLVNIVLHHPFLDRESILIHGDHVTSDDGTGCVHTAPAHGLEDYFACKANNLSTIHALNNKGVFKADIDWLAGLSTFKADNLIIEKLRELKKLILEKEFEHSYPHCWRHKTPLIFMSTPQWFISMKKSGLLEGAKEAIHQVNWKPSWGKQRIASMLENRPDWCISRQRNWGVPITLILHKESGELHPKQHSLFKDIAVIIEQQGIDGWVNLDLQDLIEDADQYVKVTDTLDVWFDSGVTHVGVIDRLYGAEVIADLYLEGSDQHRGWFQSSLLTGIGINGMPPFKEVLTHGFVVDEQGRKQSKSLGNVIAPQQVWNNLGADILRLWIASTDFRSEMVASDEIFKRTSDQYRRIRNTFRFLAGNLHEFNSQTDACSLQNLIELDKWIVNACSGLQKEVIEHYEKYEYHMVVQKIHNFCVNELGGTYLDIIKDRQYTTQPNSFARHSAQTAIDIILRKLVKLIAPVLSFTAEEVWLTYPGTANKEESIFLDEFDFIKPIESKITSQEWQTIIEIRDLVNQTIEVERNKGNIKGSLDTEVELTLPEYMYDKLSNYLPELHFLFIVSECRIQPGDVMSCNISNSIHKKCIRCWHHDPSIGENDAHPEICPRCISNVFGDGEERKFA
ncbi:MAG: isoleucine--tRNA ligase [Gammaproteobacteria bacterium]